MISVYEYVHYLTLVDMSKLLDSSCVEESVATFLGM